MNMLQLEMHREEVLKKVNELFITNRKSFLKQYRNKKGEVHYMRAKWTLTDSVIIQHLRGQSTIGVLLGNAGLTKFFTFDVDIAEPLECRAVTIKLVNSLVNQHKIPRKDIHVSISGSKGYHVDLYFDGVFPEYKLSPFYYAVLSDLDETPERIERRPTTGQGVKLPLGVHQKTGVYCTYVDNETFEPLGLQYFLNIVPISRNDFYNGVLCEYDEESIEQIRAVMPDIKTEFHGDGMQLEEVEEVLETGHLLRGGTRNNFTLYGTMYLKEKGFSEQETIIKVLEVLKNTVNDPQAKRYISMTNLETLRRETTRVVSNVYLNDYRITDKSHRTRVTLTSKELRGLLNLNNGVLARLLFILLIHSKRFSNSRGVFYCTYKQLEEQGIDKNRSRTLVKIEELQRLGFIEIIRQNGTFSALLECRLPNLYRLKLHGEQDSDLISVECTGAVSVESIVDTFTTLSLQEKEDLKSLGLKYNFDLIE